MQNCIYLSLTKIEFILFIKDDSMPKNVNFLQLSEGGIQNNAEMNIMQKINFLLLQRESDVSEYSRVSSVSFVFFLLFV